MDKEAPPRMSFSKRKPRQNHLVVIHFHGGELNHLPCKETIPIAIIFNYNKLVKENIKIMETIKSGTINFDIMGWIKLIILSIIMVPKG